MKLRPHTSLRTPNYIHVIYYSTPQNTCGIVLTTGDFAPCSSYHPSARFRGRCTRLSQRSCAPHTLTRASASLSTTKSSRECSPGLILLALATLPTSLRTELSDIHAATDELALLHLDLSPLDRFKPRWHPQVKIRGRASSCCTWLACIACQPNPLNPNLPKFFSLKLILSILFIMISAYTRYLSLRRTLLF